MNAVGFLLFLLLIIVVGIALSIFVFYAVIYVFALIHKLLFGREDFDEEIFEGDYDDGL